LAKVALVTGACGFTGSNMLEVLKEKGWEIVATDLPESDHKVFYQEKGAFHPVYYSDIIKKTGAEFIPADLTKPETLKPLFERDFDAVFSIASLYDYFAPWELLYKVNVEGHKNLVEAWLASGRKVGHWVHWATDGVYGETPYLPGDENAPYDPPNNYSRSKVEQERLLWKYYREKGLPLTVLRPAPIYGPRHIYGVYKTLLGPRKFGVGAVVRIYPREKQLMYPTVHVRDLCEAAIFVAEREDTIGEAYNVLSKCITQSEFSEFVSHLGYCSPIYRVQVNWSLYKLVSGFVIKIGRWLDARARKRGKRPKFDVPELQYITHQYWFSNEKLKELGFKYRFEDPREGLLDYYIWCKREGRL
jgi:dihydroflavonol-4-reductase